MNRTDDNFADILHHLGEEDLPFRAMSPPIFQSSLFTFENYDSFRHALGHPTESLIYSRGNNPTVLLAEKKIAALEHGQKAKLVSSGAAAIASAVMSCVSGGDHILAVADCYGSAAYLIDSYLPRFSVTGSFADGRDAESFLSQVTEKTKVIYLESPTSFTFSLQDIERITSFARQRGIKTIIDNTWATPFFQNPIDLGVDLVVHSASKYLGGNSDVVAGVVIGSTEDIERLFFTEFMPIGHVPDPMMAWLILRGLRTLHVRMPVHYRNALAAARMLESHPAIEKVNYPLLESHPQYDLATRQLSGGSGLLSFNLSRKDLEAVKHVTDSVKIFSRAVSWGGYESLICPYAVTQPVFEDIPEQKRSMIRIHTGLEDSELLLGALREVLSGL